VKRVVFSLIVLAALVSSAAVRADTTPTPTTPTVIATGVSIGGVDVSAMTADAAAAAVQEAFDQPLELGFGTTRVIVSPDLLGATASIQRAVDRAMTAVADTKIPLGVTVDRGKATNFIAGLAKRYDRKSIDSTLTLRRGRPFVTKEKAGRQLDQKRAVRDVVAALTANLRDQVKLVFRSRKPTVRRSNFGPVIVIHRGLNRLFLYHGMRFWRAFSVATGQRQYPTPLGRFTVVVKWKNPWWYPPKSPWAAGEKPVPPGPNNPLGTRWMGLSAPGVGIHGTPSDGSIGYSLSHGCIRMHIPEAEWLFNHVDVGTTVFILPH
jgi:L,D-transpeptidase catalytic domain/Putative peptidoglycan binding domain